MALVANTTHQKTARSKQRQADSGTAYQVDNTFRLTTPENISFEYKLAGPFRRFLPYVLDLAIVLAGYSAIIFLVWMVILLISAGFAYLGLFGVADFLIAIGVAVARVGFFVAYWFYGAYFETYYNGRTLGKMSASLRVISTDGHAIDGVQATLRNFFRVIDLMPVVFVGNLLETTNPDLLANLPPFLPTAFFGLIVMSLSPRFQRLGDLVAGTMVVNEERNRNPQVHSFADTRVPHLAELIPNSFYVSNSLSKAVAVYVERREQLGVARAGEIATKLAGTLLERFGLPEDTDADLLICSLYYKVFVGDANSTSEINSSSELSSASERSSTSELSSTSEANSTKDLESGLKNPTKRGPETWKTPAASSYELPRSVADGTSIVDNDAPTSNPSVPVATQVQPPTNPELE